MPKISIVLITPIYNRQSITKREHLLQEFWPLFCWLKLEGATNNEALQSHYTALKRGPSKNNSLALMRNFSIQKD
jgi:hypothetical protein